MRSIKIISILFLLMHAGCSYATHLRSANIKVESLCNGTLTYRITVTVYMNNGPDTNTQFGGFTIEDGSINFGDGIIHIIPTTPSTNRPDLGVNIGVASYSVIHTYGQAGFYQVTYFERDRSSGIINIVNPNGIPNAGDVPYVSWTSFRANAEFNCNKLPVLDIPPVDRACSFNAFYHTSGAYDVEGDSLSYELAVPYQSSETPVTGYLSPIASRFYTVFNQGNETGTGPPTFSINAQTGLITWNAPGRAGEYNIAFRIREWRKNLTTGLYELLSVTTRDMQIVVMFCDNKRPDLVDIPADTCIVAGTELDVVIKGVDPENKNVKIELFSELLNLPADKSPADYSPKPSVYRPSSPPAELNFVWSAKCLHARQQPYQVVFKITDTPEDPQEVRLTVFRTWSIKVMAPAPEWHDPQLDLVKRHALLSWEPYDCQETKVIQVWRRVGQFSYMPGECDTGMPRFLDYDLIAEVAPAETEFIDTNFDKGLSVGAQYCYRLVAVLNNNTSGIISADFCYDPIQTDAPVITHVSVEETSMEEGTIRVQWTSPFDINKTQFPEPYEYEVYRATGFSEDHTLTKIPERLKDITTFIDGPLNTRDSVFNYRVVVYAIPLGSDAYVPVDTSARASSEWLMATPALNEIKLNWRDSVPWSNVVYNRPWHRIYRGVKGQPVEDMILHDSVNVAEEGFEYMDQNLQHNVYYTYRILARGTYGNPEIPLQENFSQVVSLYPENNLQLCPAVNTIVALDCEMFRASTPCDQNTFSNTIYWTSQPSSSCRMDIAYYNIYAASDSTREFQLLAGHVRDTFFIDTNISSLAKCYRVSAVDTKGREGVTGNIVCNENCPFYELPNIFTPNEDGCNDVFSAFYYSESNISSSCQTQDQSMCPRFVNRVRFQVFNRWGREVYFYVSGEDKSVTINWDGKDNSGNDLDNGIYFYEADIQFEAMDPALRKERIKGWIHLMR